MLNEIRAIVDNDIAINAYRKDELPSPGSTVIAGIAWIYVPSDEHDQVFGRA